MSNRKAASRAAYIGLDIAISPLLKMIAEERKQDLRRHEKMMDIASQNVEAELFALRHEPRHFEVHQMYDPIIHENDFW